MKMETAKFAASPSFIRSVGSATTFRPAEQSQSSNCNCSPARCILREDSTLNV